MPSSSTIETAQKRLRVANETHNGLHAGLWTQNKHKMLFWRPKVTHTQRVSAVGQLPNEILFLIFRSINRDINDPYAFGLRKRKELRSLPLVWKAWYGPATIVLYEVIDLSSVWSVFKLHSSLVHGAHLRSYIKTLALPGRVWWTCPPRLMRMFLQIIDMADSLETLYSTCQLLPEPCPPNAAVVFRGDQVVLPFASSKHRELRHLKLYADSWNPCMFPSLIAFSFERLESLALYGFCLAETVSPQRIPPLPNLTSVTCFYGDVIGYLDEWLQSCPEVTTLLLRHTEMEVPTDDTPPLGLLKHGGISRLKIYQMYEYADDSDTLFNWFSKCEGLAILEVDLSAFSRFQAPLPVSVDTLVLRLTYEPPPLSTIISFLNRNTQVKRFELEACSHNRWFLNNRSRLEKEISDRGAIMLLDYVPCFCRSRLAQVTYDIMDPVTRWTRRYPKGIRDNEMADIIDWELS